jgi:hypothetical protein
MARFRSGSTARVGQTGGRRRGAIWEWVNTGSLCFLGRDHSDAAVVELKSGEFVRGTRWLIELGVNAVHGAAGGI